MKLIKHGANVHELILEKGQDRVAMLSDLHWDNPKCDWTLLKKHLDHCKENDIPVMVNGDFFCLMQGRGDKRSNKSDIRPEHNNAKYLDSIIETAVKFFKPYAEILTVLGYGNHETAIIKWQETDILQRFVDILNYECKTEVMTGGYGGWLIIKREFMGGLYPFKIKYFHGSGGGGVVTKGALNLTRALEAFEGFDVFTMGHIHENSARNDVRDVLDASPKVGYRVQHKYIHSMITGCYKEEYGDGSKGWHVERGAPVKPIGGRMMILGVERSRVGGEDCIKKWVDSKRLI